MTNIKYPKSVWMQIFDKGKKCRPNNITGSPNNIILLTVAISCLDPIQLGFRPMHWAIPEIICTPKRRHGNPKNVTHIFSWELPKNEHFFGSSCKEDMGIPEVFDCFQYKNGTSQFVTVFDIKNCEFLSFFSPSNF